MQSVSCEFQSYEYDSKKNFQIKLNFVRLKPVVLQFFFQVHYASVCLFLLDLTVRIPTCSNHSKVTRYFPYCMRRYEWASIQKATSSPWFVHSLYLGNIKSGQLHLTITQFKLLSEKVAGKKSVMVTIWEAQSLLNNTTEASLLSRQNARNFSDLILI